MNPFESMATSLSPWAGESTVDLMRHLERDSSHLRRVIQSIVDRRPAVHLLLILDSFEDLFAVSLPEAKRQLIFDALTELATKVGRWTFIPVFPLHILGSPVVYESVGPLLTQSIAHVVSDMAPAEIEWVIRQPAANAGVRFEDGLVQRIVSDAGSNAGSLALVQLFLPELWTRLGSSVRAPGWWLTHESYESAGQFAGFLTNYAGQMLESLDPPSRRIAKDLLNQIADLSTDGVFLPSRTLFAGVIDQLRHHHEEILIWKVVRELAKMRLVVLGLDAGFGQAVIEIAHPALAKMYASTGPIAGMNLEFRRWRAKLGMASSSPDIAALSRVANSYIILYKESERIEREAEIIWVITRHFVWNLYHPFQKIVKSNLLSGKRYHFIYPSDVQAQADQLRLECGIEDNSQQIQFTPINSRHFLFVHHQIVIYDPHKPWPQCKGSIVDLPNIRTSETFDVSIGKEDLADYIKEFRDIVSKHASGSARQRIGNEK